MKTDDFVALLARDAGAAPRWPVARRLGPALALGLAVALMLATGWPVRPWATATGGPVLAAKVVYGAAVALVALALAARLARPVARVPGVWRRWAGVLPVALMLAALAVLAAQAAPASTWRLASGLACALTTGALAVPMLAAGFWALRGLAPVRPVHAGAAVGLLAGSVGVCAYALVCPEAAPGFVAVWYSLAMAAPTALGAWLGPRLLRW